MSEDTAGKIRGRSGGLARAEALSDDEKRAIAKKAAESRWLRATHKGNFYQDFGIDVDCYVLNDPNKTAVISQTGMGSAIGLSSRGNAFPRFLASRAMVKHLGAELSEKFKKPIKFQWTDPGAQPPSEVHGSDVTLLIDVCKAIQEADRSGDLADNQKRLAMQASVILNASAKSGIQNLVYKLAGYDATREEIIANFRMFVRQEAREYEKEFPNQLYEEWYRLYQLPKPERNRPWKFMHLTNEHVYWPLARSKGKVLELTKMQRQKAEQRHKRLHQFLSDVGVKALRTHLGQLLGIAQVSREKDEYEQHVRRIFGDQRELDL